ncbi:hypothetical protein A0256_23530 [Mucilaginibacter sp. PAMC 26640]|nr:hypothetical protein A0256_23530 [Mucilaginibacter sp. PAMC 26640]
MKNSFNAGSQDQIEQLKKFINSTTNSAKQSLLAGVLLALSGAGVLFLPNFSESTNVYQPVIYFGPVVAKMIVAGLIEITAISLIYAYKSSIKQASDYRTELIALRDLNIALEIADNTSDKDYENTQINNGTRTITRYLSQKSKMEQSVIEALLNRYS